MGGEVIFEVYDAQQARLVGDWDAADGFRLLQNEIGVSGKPFVAPGIVDEYRFSGPLDIVNDPMRDLLTGGERSGCHHRGPALLHIAPRYAQELTVLFPEEHAALCSGIL